MNSPRADDGVTSPDFCVSATSRDSAAFSSSSAATVMMEGSAVILGVSAAAVGSSAGGAVAWTTMVEFFVFD